MHRLVRLTARVGLIVSVAAVVLVAGCSSDAPPTARSLPGGQGMLNSAPVGGDDWTGKGKLVPGIDFCSYAASSGLDDFVFFVWGDFAGGAESTTTKNKDGLKFHGHLINQPDERNVEFAGETTDGKTGHVTIEGKKYDLANGTLFLVSARRGYHVVQLKRDMTRFQNGDRLFKDFSKNDTDVVKFFRPTYFIWINIPRLPNNDKSYADVMRVLKELPSFAKPTRDSKTNSLINANTNRISDGPMNIQFHFSPTPTSDLGDVAKALATLSGDKTKPAATVNLAAATPIDEKRFAQLKSELSTAKGINWENSSRSALALDETGGAKFEVIRTAYKKAGITLSDAYIDR